MLDAGMRERLSRVVANAANHGRESVRSLRGQVGAKSEMVEQRHGVDFQNPACRSFGTGREQSGDQASNEVGIAVAGEAQHRLPCVVDQNLGYEPHLACAARYLIGLGSSRLRQRLKGAPQFAMISSIVMLVRGIP